MKKLLLCVPLIEFGQQGWETYFHGISNGSGFTDAVGYSVIQNTDGDYIVIVSMLVKIDADGNENWRQEIQGYDVQQTSDGGYIICGVTDINLYEDIYQVKTNSEGIVTSAFNIPINPNRKLEKTVDILGKETKPKTNIPFIEIYDDGTVEKRIVIE